MEYLLFLDENEEDIINEFVDEVYQQTDTYNEKSNDLKGEYSSNIDLSSVFEQLKDSIKSKNLSLIKQYSDQISQIKKSISSCTRLEYNNYNRKCQDLQEKIDIMKSNINLSNYIDEAENLVERFKKINHDVRIDKDDEDEDPDKVRIIQDFFEITSKYISHEFFHKKRSTSYNCQGCGFEIKETIGDDGIIICPNCDGQFCPIVTFKNLGEKNITLVNSTKDDSMNNFISALEDYLGIKNVDMNKTLITNLDKYFKSKMMLTGKQIKKLPLNPDGTRGTTKVEIMRKALTDLHEKSQMKNVHSIARNYWGWSKPKQSHLRNIIIEDYIKTQNVYNSIPISERKRKSSLGTEYRLWRHLQLRNYPCDKSDFKISKSDDSLILHDKLWKRMCEGAGDPDIYYIDD